ncbi:peptidoglycan DD-metalloendopeptidase family protein [Arthrobacter glacialis]|uniref:peptidoglycan DD-metalloendopeptidase family protein n=1 Tax=Arthrobacter glacialis TaxID=1664 RepID=UPI0013FE49BD|nr:peptidoglycan DD-metalloendopeptidase family protein [Arthrobacter glacialis]
MPVVGIAEIEVKPLFKGTQAAIGQMVDGSAEAAGTSAGKSMGTKLGGALATTVKATAGVAFAGLALAVTKGFGRLQAIEQAKAKLTGLGHTAESVTEIMKNASASVKGTAFGMDEAATVAAGAVAAGVVPGKELERTLKLTGDAATIAGVGMSDMGAIFNKVASSNKIQGDVIAQLSDSGIPIVQLLGKELGTTAEETLKLAKEGKINFETFQAAMEKGMGGAALESGKTLQGAFKNTMASVGRIGANLLSGVYPLFTKFFQGLIAWMEPLEAKAKVVGAAIGTSMEKASTAVMGIYSIMAKGDFTGGLGVEEDSKLVDFLFRLREGFISLSEAFKGTASILFKGDFIGGLGVEEDSKLVDFLFRVREGFLSIGVGLGLLNFSSWDAFKSSAAEAGGTVGGAFASMGESLHTLGPAFAEFGRQLPNITGAFVKLGGVSLNFLVVGLGFLADNVDTIIAWMPAIVTGFIAWRVATNMLASSQFFLQAGQVAAAPVLLANNILRYASVRAETALSIATGQSTAATNVSIAAKIRDRVTTVAGTVSTWAAAAAQTAWTVAKQAATVATRLLGVAIKFAMGPVGLIIAAIALLVGGLIWFFTQTDLGKDIVKNAFAVIQIAVAAVVTWWNNTLVPALQAVGQWFKDVWDGAAKAVQVAVGWVQDAIANVIDWIQQNWGLLLTIILGPLGFIVQWVVKNFSQISATVQAVFAAVAAAFVWVYESIIKPVFDSIMVIANGFYLFFRGIFQLVVAVFKEIIAPAFMEFWHGVVEPVFNGIIMAAQLWWAIVSGTFNNVVSFIQTVLGAVFTWFRDSVVMPVFNFIVGYISWWWGMVSGTFNNVVSFIQTVLGAVFTWFRDSVVMPVFNFIAGVITTWWSGTQIIFNAVVGFVRNTLGAVFTWLRDSIINPVWNGIRDTISAVWNNGIKPVFDFLAGAIQKDVPNAFQKGVDGVKSIWDKLLDIAKAPVRFIIDTVINGGLIDTFNKVAKMLPGITELDHVAKPAGFAEGGWTGPGSKYQPAGVVHADEFVVNKASRRGIERRAPGLLDSLNTFGASALSKLGYAKGGRVNPVKNMTLTQGFTAFHDGIDIGVGTGTPVFAAGAGRITHAGPGATAPGVSGGNEVHLLSDGVEQWYAHLSQIGVKLGQMVAAGQQIALSGNTGISSGPHLHFGAYNGRWPNAINPLGYLSGAETPKGGGGFLDPLGALTGLAEKIVGQIKGAFPLGGFMIDAVTGVGKKAFSSVIDWAKDKLGFGAVTGAQQGAHLNPILYDQGGILRPGLSQIMNATGKPEAIYTNEQDRALQALAARGAQGSGLDAAALDRLTKAVQGARGITVQAMSSEQAQLLALARAMRGIG